MRLIILMLLLSMLSFCGNSIIKESVEYIQYSGSIDTFPELILYTNVYVESSSSGINVRMIYDYTLNKYSRTVDHIKDSVQYMFYLEKEGSYVIQGNQKYDLCFLEKKEMLLKENDELVYLFSVINPPIDGENVYYVNPKWGLVQIINKDWNILTVRSDIN